MPQIINQNIRFLREKAHWTQKELAIKLNIKVPAVGAYEEFRATPPIPVIIKIADLFKVDIDSLLRTNLTNTKPAAKSNNLSRNSNILSITVDRDDKENVELVTQKASAGYLNGYADPEFVKELPKISIPTLAKNATHRAFEIKGDSMLPVKPGDIIIGKYVENFDRIKDGKTYVIISDSEGIVYKRVFAFRNDEKLLLVSDNKNYKPYLVSLKDVTEVWAFTARITMDDVAVDSLEGVSLNFLATKWMEMLNKV